MHLRCGLAYERPGVHHRGELDQRVRMHLRHGLAYEHDMTQHVGLLTGGANECVGLLDDKTRHGVASSHINDSHEVRDYHDA